mgnify:FL=1
MTFTQNNDYRKVEVIVSNKLEEILSAAKINELLHRKEKEEDKKSSLLWILAIVGAVAAIAGIAFAVYKFLTPDYLEDFDEDFDDDFDDDFYDESEYDFLDDDDDAVEEAEK